MKTAAQKRELLALRRANLTLLCQIHIEEFKKKTKAQQQAILDDRRDCGEPAAPHSEAWYQIQTAV